MRLERSGLISGLGEQKPFAPSESQATVLSFGKAVPLPAKAAVTKGELKIALAKLKDVADNKPLVSAGIPFAPGQLKSKDDFAIFDADGHEIPIAVKVLAFWPSDGSIRSVLVQFKYPIEHLYEYATLQWGLKRSTTDLSIVGVE